MHRRTFLQFLGKGLIVSPIAPSILSSCSQSGDYLSSTIEGISPQFSDEIVLAEGLEYKILIKWGDAIGDGFRFGYNNDYTAFLPQGAREGLLWVNHEYVDPKLSSGYDPEKARLKSQILAEMDMVGGSLLKIRKKENWQVVIGHDANDRLTGGNKIPFEWPEKVAGSNEAIGTLANCSGGVTPWGTILTCEENYDLFYGDKNFENGDYFPSELEWEVFFPRNKTEHYGWVVEYDPATKTAKKHVSLGRFAHECATVKELEDGRIVIYSGDDQNDGCLYKYISDQPGQVSPGQLYVADTANGVWKLLSMEDNSLNSRFENETELKIRTREAAKIVGGSALDRPEDIEIDPIDGSVIVAMTNNQPKGNYFGSIMRLRELDGYDGLSFTTEDYLTGGEEMGFACPDNMAFDAAGNLWFTSDISGSSMNLPPYEKFGNNGLFVVMRAGVNAGKVTQIASAPNDAEFSGPSFAPDGTLFLSVQHPGETSPSPDELTSTWPDGPGNLPKSAVIAITGKLMSSIVS